MSPYRSDCGPPNRACRWGELPSAVGVLDEGGKRIGMALGVGIGADGAALWRLTIGGAALPGRYVLRGRAFERASIADDNSGRR